VGIENAALIYKAARHPKSFVAIDTGHHLLLAERDSVFVGSVLAAWAVRYVNQAEQHAAH
jgi:putative redox protein